MFRAHVARKSCAVKSATSNTYAKSSGISQCAHLGMNYPTIFKSIHELGFGQFFFVDLRYFIVLTEDYFQYLI